MSAPAIFGYRPKTKVTNQYPSETQPWALKALIWAGAGLVLYLLAVPLSRMTVFTDVGLAMMWFPPAVFVGFIARNPLKWLPVMIPTVALSEFLAAFWLQGLALGPSLFWVVADTLDIVACGVLMRVTGAYRLRRPADFLKFLAIVPSVMLVGSFFGAAGAVWEFGADFWTSYISWFIGCTFGILVVSPLFMRFRISRSMSLVGPFESTLLVLLVLIVALVSFLGETGLTKFALESFLLLPVSVWLALRVGINLTSVVVPISVFLGSYAAAQELGLTVVTSVGLTAYSETAAFMVGLALTAYAVATVAEQQSYSVEKLRHQATTDSLTGLPNRRWLMDKMTEIAHSHTPSTVVVLDIIGFGNINESMGHAAGDEVLVTAARRLAQAAGPHRFVSRISGDEFVVIGTYSSDEAALDLAQVLRSSLREPCLIGQRQLRLESDCGVAQDDDGSQTQQLLPRADVALLQARRVIGPAVRIYSPEIARNYQHQTQARALINQALEQDLVQFHLQPVFNTATGQLEGCEALMRLDDLQGRCHGPGDFIDVAEATGLIVPLGRAMLRQSLTWLATHHQRSGQFRMAINTSVPELADSKYVADLLGLLEETEVSPSNIVVEVTERTLMDLGQYAVETLDQLRATGIQVALDDFGTGYSSMSALRSLPIDILKIDRSFVSGLPDVSDDIAIVAGVHRLAHDLGLTTVAEGVEKPAQREMLRALGVEQLQGYLLGRPIPPAEFLDQHLPITAP